MVPNKHLSPLICFPHASLKKHLWATFVEKKILSISNVLEFHLSILYEPFAKSENKKDAADI